MVVGPILLILAITVFYFPLLGLPVWLARSRRPRQFPEARGRVLSAVAGAVVGTVGGSFWLMAENSLPHFSWDILFLIFTLPSASLGILVFRFYSLAKTGPSVADRRPTRREVIARLTLVGIFILMLLLATIRILAHSIPSLLPVAGVLIATVVFAIWHETTWLRRSLANR
jgi:hypothetical protein